MKKTLITTFLCNFITVYAGYITPEQVHLSWTGIPNEMRVTWVTFFPIENTIYYQSVLCSKDPTWHFANSSYSSLDTGTFFYHIEFIHTGVIKTDPNCIYNYYVGSWMGYSKVYSFKGRTSGSNDYSKSDALIIGDWGGGTAAMRTKSLMTMQLEIDNCDTIIHLGDIAYDLHNLQGMVGDIWFNMVQPIAANIPYMVLPGNHESHGNYTIYRNKFKMPVNEANDASGFFYSFDYGRAHYITLNTNIYFGKHTAGSRKNQENWLIKDLKKANENRQNVPWIIILNHHTLYCSVDWTKKNEEDKLDCGAESSFLQSIYEDVIYEAGVDLFMQAHVHRYERNGPIYRNFTVESDYDDDKLHVNPRAPVYITNGNGGNFEAHNDLTSTTPQLWSKYGSDEYGYGKLTVFNKSHIYYEQYSSRTENIIDYVWIVKYQERY